MLTAARLSWLQRKSPSIFNTAASEIRSAVESADEDKAQEAVTILKNGWPSKATAEHSALAQPLHHGCILGRSLASLCIGCASAKRKLLCFLPGTPGLEDECTNNDCYLLQEWMLHKTLQSQHWAVQCSGLSTAPQVGNSVCTLAHFSPPSHFFCSFSTGDPNCFSNSCGDKTPTAEMLFAMKHSQDALWHCAATWQTQQHSMRAYSQILGLISMELLTAKSCK